jgi:hypothetical protein
MNTVKRASQQQQPIKPNNPVDGKSCRKRKLRYIKTLSLEEMENNTSPQIWGNKRIDDPGTADTPVRQPTFIFTSILKPLPIQHGLS